MILVPYTREQNAVIETKCDEDGYPVHQSHTDRCPGCKSSIVWERYADEWSIDNAGNVIEPQWSAWHGTCTTCFDDFVIPYDDGTARCISDDPDYLDDDDDWDDDWCDDDDSDDDY